MTDLNDMSLEKFRLWTQNALRVYLSLRNKNIEGTFEELVARAFCTWEERIPVDISAEQKERQLLQEYKDKLNINGLTIEDPLASKEGWLGEQTGISKWPSLYITDISIYLSGKHPDALINRLLSEYKVGKAYSYFTGEWVKEVYYREIENIPSLCCFKARVTPSQSINNRPYDAWVVVMKDTKNSPGGEIVTGYCTCTAGMLGSCNHIAGVLFRIEHAVKNGLTKLSSTSQKCFWNVPKLKTTIKPGKATDFVWKKSKYSRAIDFDKEQEKCTKKSKFTPYRQTDMCESPANMRKRLYDSLHENLPNSCFSLLVKKTRMNKDFITDKLPLTVNEAVAAVKHEACNNDQLVFKLKQKLQLSFDQIRTLEQATVEQGSSESWKEQRKGRITASVFYRVYTRAKTLKLKPNESPLSVVNLVLGANNHVCTKAMKHGIALEPYAKKQYAETLRKKHLKFKSVSSGLSIFEDHPYLAASPDLLVECQCCGAGLCEIKCPESIKDTKPSVDNVPYIFEVDGKLQLKKQHSYFYQVQGQMGITGKSYCDFFIFTCHGHLCFRIDFDRDFFEEMIKELAWFWEKFVAPRFFMLDPQQNVKTDKAFENF